LVLALSTLASLSAAQAGSGGVFYEAPGDGKATLRQESGSLQLVDGSHRVLAALPLREIRGGVVIRGMGHAFALTVDASVQPVPGGIHFDGGAGRATLTGPGQPGVTWHLTGPSSGDLIEPGFLTFAGVRDLIGAADNEDVFVIAGGTLPGVVEGGDRGYDTMVIEGSYGSVVLGATAGDSGWVDLDGRRVEYDGLEPVDLGGPVANLTLDLSGLADFGILETVAAPGRMQLRTATFTAETQIFSAPTNSLTIRLGGADDILQIDSLAAGFAANLIVDGQDGLDRVTINGTLDLGGGNLDVTAESISLPATRSILGANTVSLNARNLASRSVDPTAITNAVLQAVGLASPADLATFDPSTVNSQTVADTIKATNPLSYLGSTASISIAGTIAATGDITFSAQADNAVAFSAAVSNNVAVFRETVASVTLQGASITTDGSVSISANNGGARGAINEPSRVVINFGIDSASTTVSATAIAAGSLEIAGFNLPVYSITGSRAIHQFDGGTTILIENSPNIVLGTGGLATSALDTSSLTTVTTGAPGTAINYYDKNTNVTVSSSSITANGGPATLSASGQASVTPPSLVVSGVSGGLTNLTMVGATFDADADLTLTADAAQDGAATIAVNGINTNPANRTVIDNRRGNVVGNSILRTGQLELNAAQDLTADLIVENASSAVVNVGRDFTGRLIARPETSGGSWTSITIGRNMTPIAQITATGDLGTLSVVGSLQGRVVTGGNLGSLSVNGNFNGVVGVGGDIGEALSASGTTLVRGGSVRVDGNFTGQLAAMGNFFADALIGGDFTGRWAVRGRAVPELSDSLRSGILGEVRVNGTFGPTAAILSNGQLGDSVLGNPIASMRATSITGILVSYGNMVIGPNPAGTAPTPFNPSGIFANRATKSGSGGLFGPIGALPSYPLDPIFTNGGVPLYIDPTPLGQAYTNLILIDLASLTIVGRPVNPPDLISASFTIFRAETPGTFTFLSSENGTITHSGGALPSGVTFLNGVLSGTPAPGTGGLYPLAFATANGVAPDGSQAFTLVVHQDVGLNLDGTLVSGASGSTTVATGFPAPTITTTDTLPEGLSFQNGVIVGTPAPGTTGRYVLTVTASNGVSPDVSGTFTLTIAEPPSLVVTTADDIDDEIDGLISLREAIAYASTLGGTPAITFSDGTGGTLNFFDGTPRTMVLSAELVVDAAMAIAGPGAHRLTISGNDAVRVFRIEDPATLSGLTLSHGNSGADPGAGILSNAPVTLREMAITDNKIAEGGAGIFMTAALTMINCTVSGNDASTSFNGGGLQLNGNAPSAFINCTISDNRAARGGGIRITSGSLTLTHCTITDNTGEIEGGGVSVSNATIPVTVANTLIAANTSPSAVASDVHGVFTSAGGNLIGMAEGSSGFTHGVNGDQVGTVATPIDPMLGLLGNNGGPTATHALLAGSPAIHGGLNANIPADAFDLDGNNDTGEPLPFDQRGLGFPRRHGTAAVDIGAFESNAAPLAPNGLATATTGDQTTFTLPATDADGDTLILTGTTPDSHLTVDSTSGLDVTITAAADFAGDATLGYTVSDGLGGTASGTVTVTIADNDDPTIQPAGGGFSPLLFAAGPMPDYRDQVDTGDNIAVTSVTQNPPEGSAVMFSDLPVTVTLTAHDAAGNTADLTFSVTIRPAAPVNTAYLSKGDTAPGAGTDGLPADAKLTQFQIPAIDDAGRIAFVAKWTSATGGGGTGLFFDDQCLAFTPGAPPIAGAAYRSFTDPVIDGGKVTCIAALNGVPKSTASVVLSSAATAGALEVIARTGDIAPIADGSQPATGAKFAAFKAVALADGVVGIFAQLTGGTGADKATAATDLGLWIKDGSGPLRLAVREGQQIAAGKVIKTLTSFGAGAGSPGQGRGWVERVNGEAAVLARVVYIDKSQAALCARLAGGLVAVTTLIDTSTILPPAFLVTGVGFPAINRDAEVAILASTASEFGPRPTVLVKRTGTGFIRTAAIRAASPLAGTTFSVVKDPVLAPDGGIAFPASLKVKGVAANTLWWQPAGEDLLLLAQGGPNPAVAVTNDLPAGAQWKTFTSLAIADGRGPIFAATLVPNRGGVTTATASGVWAVDFQGTLRTLFRTGAPIAAGGKTVKSFTLLKATVGTTGVTRSFNDSAQVVWLATFTDKSQAIVRTEVP